MRVLHFLPVYAPAWQYGGPILSVSRLCEALVQEGVEVRVITTNAGLPHLSTSNPALPTFVNGVEVFYYPVDKSGRPISSRSLTADLPRHIAWADLLHLSSIWQPLGLKVQKAAHAAGIPVIQTLRGALSPYSWTRSLYKKLPYYFFKERPLLQLASTIHCTTPQEINEVNTLRLKPPVVLLPNPLELNSLYYSSELGIRWRNLHNIPQDCTLFIIAGRLHHKKGLDLLPNVLSDFSYYNWQLLVIGDDDDGTGYRLRKSFEQLGLASRCHWLDAMPSDELIEPFNAADWLLFPSRHENFGNVAVEALSCGCGVLLSTSVGAKDYLTKCPGVFSADRVTHDWTNLIHLALRSSRPGTDSEKYVKELFSKSLVAQQALNIYRRLITHE